MICAVHPAGYATVLWLFSQMIFL